MRILSIVLIIVALAGCNTKNNTDTPQDATKHSTDSLGLTTEIHASIQELTKLECRLLELYAKPYDKQAESTLIEEMIRIQEQRSAVFAKLMKHEIDSVAFKSIQLELKRISESDEYCGGLDLESKPASNVRKDGSPVGEKNIKEDAGRLANLNCRLMEAHKSLGNKPGDSASIKQVALLKREKQELFRSLALNYGPRVIHDPFFRKLVYEAQEQQCNYNSELKASGRLPVGAL